MEPEEPPAETADLQEPLDSDLQHGLQFALDAVPLIFIEKKTNH